MLKHADCTAREKRGSGTKEGSVASSLVAASETGNPLEAIEELSDVIETLFADAGLRPQVMLTLVAGSEAMSKPCETGRDNRWTTRLPLRLSSFAKAPMKKACSS
jgi:hypothetical protein